MANLIYVSTTSTLYVSAVSTLKMAGWSIGALPAPPPKWMVVNPNNNTISFSNNGANGSNVTATSVGDIVSSITLPTTSNLTVETHEIVIDPVSPFTGTDQWDGKVVLVPDVTN